MIKVIIVYICITIKLGMSLPKSVKDDLKEKLKDSPEVAKLDNQ